VKDIFFSFLTSLAGFKASKEFPKTIDIIFSKNVLFLLVFYRLMNITSGTQPGISSPNIKADFRTTLNLLLDDKD